MRLDPEECSPLVVPRLREVISQPGEQFSLHVAIADVAVDGERSLDVADRLVGALSAVNQLGEREQRLALSDVRTDLPGQLERVKVQAFGFLRLALPLCNLCQAVQVHGLAP